MADYNPYAAPAHADEARNGPGAVVQGEYVPLGTRMVLATTSVLATVFFASAMEITQATYGDRLVSVTHGQEGYIANTAPLLLFALASLLALAARVASWVTVCVWTYRAAANLRGLGRWGMANTPGWRPRQRSPRSSGRTRTTSELLPAGRNGLYREPHGVEHDAGTSKGVVDRCFIALTSPLLLRPTSDRRHRRPRPRDRPTHPRPTPEGPMRWSPSARSSHTRWS